jgi:gliding motility-associated-like protein
LRHFNYTTILAFAILALAFFSSKKGTAQCFEIESILVDACGTPESENEMVRFAIGNAPLNTNDLSVSWATTANPWLGTCQGANTAQKTAELNATITTCGFLKEPTNGVLPAGARVILVTSTNIDATFNSFDGLSDTLYIIYQCNGNTYGHFGNHGSSSIKTFSMTFSGLGGCTDQVTYNRSFLMNQSGGTGGSSGDKDGGTVEYTANGTATYSNFGCQAPITPNSIAISAFPTSICPLDSINLNALSSNNNVVWSGGNGTFSNQNNVNTVYYSDASDVFPITIYAGFLIPCGDTLFDSTEIVLNTNANIFVTPSATSLCEGETITLTASGASSYTWNDGSTGTTLTIDTAGTFFTTTDQCGIDTATIDIAWNGSTPSVSLSGNNNICQGETTQITASGDGPFTWHNNTIGSIYDASSNEDIYASVTNNCGTDTAFMTINITGTPPTASITGDLIVCGDDSTTLTASGGNSYLWSNGTTNSTSTADTSGFLIATNNCGADTSFFTLTSTGALPEATINGDPNICDNKPSLFSASGGDTYLWHNGNNTAYLTTAFAEEIYVIASNACGQDTAYLSLIDQSVIANFDISDSIGYQPLIIDFTNLSLNANQYNWDFGNGVLSSYEDEEQTYTTEGNFIAQLIVANSFCTDTAFKKITILNNTNVFIPNSFSPNGDYINDEFRPVLSNIIEDGYSMSIFNRNGEIIFNTETLGESWNGTERGTSAPSGVYIWKIKYKIEGELNIQENMGHVNLIR